MIGAFLDSISFIIIIPPLTIACIAMYQGAGVHWSVILKDLVGVPLGLLMCFIGFVGMAANMSDPSLLGPTNGNHVAPTVIRRNTCVYWLLLEI